MHFLDVLLERRHLKTPCPNRSPRYRNRSFRDPKLQIDARGSGNGSRRIRRPLRRSLRRRSPEVMKIRRAGEREPFQPVDAVSCKNLNGFSSAAKNEVIIMGGIRYIVEIGRWINHPQNDGNSRSLIFLTVSLRKKWPWVMITRSGRRSLIKESNFPFIC